jgi:hypothetical protein
VAKQLLVQSILAWLVILGLAVANGAFRDMVLIPELGKVKGLLWSGILLGLLVSLVAYTFVRLKQGITVLQSLLIGVLWLCLTLAFEFAFGRLVQGKSWDELLGAYTFKDGNLWSFVVLMTFLSPYLAVLAKAEEHGPLKKSKAKAPPGGHPSGRGKHG